MAKEVVDLDRLKQEVVEYLGGSGLPIFYCFGVPAEEGYVYWDTEHHSDWRQFADVARESGARLFLFVCRELDAGELAQARETLSEVEMVDGDREDATAFLDTLRPHIGHVA